MSARQVEVLAYVIDALRRQERRHRMNHWPVPSGVTELVEEIGFRVSRGQAGSSLESGERCDHVENVKTLAVRYETAAQMLEVSVSTIKRLVASGELHPVALGGSRRLRVAELEKFLAGEEVQ